MTELLSLYKWTLIGALLIGALLSLIGSQLASRNQTVQTLVVSQAAAMGATLGLAINIFIFSHHSHGDEHESLPFLTSLICSSIFYLICERIVIKNWPSRNTYFIGLFVFLMAITFGVTSLVPGLETHMSSSYFGDVALASHSESHFVGLVGLFGLGFFYFFSRSIVSWSFQLETFATFYNDKKQKNIQRVFLIVTLLAVAASVQLLGLLFTLSCLFVPTIILSRLKNDFSGFFKSLIQATVIGISIGFLVSLYFDQIPTVPSITMFLIIIPLLQEFLLRVSRAIGSSSKCLAKKVDAVY